MAKERMSKQGTLLGPKNASTWVEWRQTRENRIQNPRRLKTVEDKDDEKSPAQTVLSESGK